MKQAVVAPAVLALLAGLAEAKPAPDVDTMYPYKGPDVPVGDWVDPTINGNGKGFPRLVEAPAVKPASANPTNNINVIAVSYTPNGVNIHYQTPFGLGEAPTIHWGTSASSLDSTATGKTVTYDRTPPCSAIASVTQCSQFFHDVLLSSLEAGRTYYYQIAAANGTTASDVLSVSTARAAGAEGAFTVAVVNDMGYTNAAGTYSHLMASVNSGETAFVWHGGDLSYADDWYSGILPCEDSWPVCYNGTDTALPGGGPVPDDYKTPLPAGEIPNQGGARGGDMSVLYESNWDLWQQWMNNVTMQVPYMVLAGNHEDTCAEFDGGQNVLSAYLDKDEANSTSDDTTLNYYSCPPSQRNFTAFQNRFHMAGEESGGVGNFWYSFDYGLAHFVSLDTETDFADSPDWPFARDIEGGNETHPTPNETYVTDAGPFGTIDGGNIDDNTAYQQYQWLAKDLASVDRCKTPWVIAMGHRPMYSSQVSSYQLNLRNAFEDLMLKNSVDAYISGHIHWYERIMPMAKNGTIDTTSFVANNSYLTNPGVSMTHLINGAAGNIESHSTLDGDPLLNVTVYLDQVHYGFAKLTVHNASTLSWKYIHGDSSGDSDWLVLNKREGAASPTCSASNSSSSAAPSSGSGSASGSASVVTVTETVSSYTTYCPASTTLTLGSSTYTISSATTLTVTDCPCTLTHTSTVATATSVVTSGKPVPTTVTGFHNSTAAVSTPAAGTASGSVPVSSAAATSPTSVVTSEARKAYMSPFAGLLAFAAMLL